MADLLLKIPDELRTEFKTIFGKEIPEEMLQLLFSRFLNEELREKLAKIKKIESIVSKSELTEKQAKELADEVSVSVSKRFLESVDIKSSLYPEES